MRINLKTCGLAVGSVGLAAGAVIASPPSYRVDVLTELTQKPWNIGYPNGISGSGLAVGYASAPGELVRGWAWDGGSLRFLSPPTAGAATFASGVNASGSVLGWIEVDGIASPAVWSGELVTLLPRLNPDEYTGAYAINDHGDVVGASVNAGILWHDGIASVVAPLAGTTRAHPVSINNAGVMSGHAVLEGGTLPARWIDGVGELLPVPDAPEGQTWFAYNVSDINEQGEIIGASFLGGARARAYVWRDGEVFDLAPFDAANPTLVIPEGINDGGWIVGQQSGVLSEWGAFLWIDGVMHDLRELVGPEFAGLELLTANSINNDGVIAGTAWIDGAQVPVLLTPIPGPGAAALLAVGTLVHLRRRR